MRAVIVASEGTHDIHFLARSVLHNEPGWARWDRSVRDLPTPFGGERQRGVVVQQMGLDQRDGSGFTNALFGKKPLYELALHHAASEQYLFFVNMGGDESAEGVHTLVRLLLTAVGNPEGTTTERLAFVFVFDADAKSDKKGTAWRVGKFNSDYGSLFDLTQHHVGPGSWTKRGLVTDFVATLGLNPDAAPPGADADRQYPVLLWVHEDATAAEGTMETHGVAIARMDRTWCDRLDAAVVYIETNTCEGHFLRSKTDKRNKALLTIVGQLQERVEGEGGRYLAGSSMSVAVERGLPAACFHAPVTQNLAKLLTTVPWC